MCLTDLSIPCGPCSSLVIEGALLDAAIENDNPWLTVGTLAVVLGLDGLGLQSIMDYLSYPVCKTKYLLLDDNELKISSEADLSNETRFPLMHAQLNGRSFGNNPHHQIKAMRDYIKSYFYELIFLSLTSDEKEENNKFVSYNDVTQHDSTNISDFLKDVDYKKILIGEIFHSIEDSFAHNIRYLAYHPETGEKIFKIGAVLNMRIGDYEDYISFSHDDDYYVNNWNCKSVDAQDSSYFISSQFLPVNTEYFSFDGTEIDHFMINDVEVSFLDDYYGSTFAERSVADFLWYLSESIKNVNERNNSNEFYDKELIESYINEYLDKWFMDGTEILDPKVGLYPIPSRYDDIIERCRWDNFHNIDFWVESRTKDIVDFGMDAAFLPWVPLDLDRRKGIENNIDRFVVETFEDNESYAVAVAQNLGIVYSRKLFPDDCYDERSRILTLKKSVLSIFYSWRYDLNDGGENKIDINLLEDEDFKNGNVEEKLVYEIPTYSNSQEERGASAIFAPRGTKVCLVYDAYNVQNFESNDAAQFFKMPTYRCFYGGEEGRLITGGKEDALKPGTKVYVKIIDIDNDRVLDWNDNCPLKYNPEQKDWNWNGIGDICDNFDDDIWFDDKDPCPEVYNESICTEIHSTAGLSEMQCRQSIQDGTNDPATCWEEVENCRKSVSDCCLNARLKCDMDSDGRWDLEPDPDYYIDDYLYYSRGVWSKEGGHDVEITNCHSSTFTEFCIGSQYLGNTLYISHNAGYFCGQDYEEKSKSQTYFCYCGKDSDAHLKCNDNAACGPNHAEPVEPWDYAQNRNRPTWLPAYDSRETIENDLTCRWSEKIRKINRGKSWDYHNNTYLHPELHDAQGESTVPKVNNAEEYNDLLLSGEFPMLKLSQAASQINQDYVPEDLKVVNKNYFSNNHQNHVKPQMKNMLKLADKVKNSSAGEDTVDLILVKSPWLRAKWIPGFADWYWQMMKEYIGGKPWDGPKPWEDGIEESIRGNLYESIMRPSEFSKVKFNGESIDVEPVYFAGNYHQIFDFNGVNAVYYEKDDQKMLALADISGIFKQGEIVSDGIELRSPAVTVKSGEIFMAAGVTTSNPYTSLEVIPQNSIEITPERNTNFVKITFTENGPQMTTLSSLPWAPVYISLFESEEKVHAIMTDSSGAGQILAYFEDNQSWTVLYSFNFQTKFSLNNTFVKNGALYFTAPGANGQNSLYLWNSESGIQEKASLSINYDPSIKPFIYGEQVVLADLKDISRSNVRSWFLTESGFAETFIGIAKTFESEGPCLYVEGSNVSGGIFVKGECRPFKQKQKRVVNFSQTVRAVAGSGTLLAVATYSKIFIYNNENPESPTLIYEKSVYGPVRDLAIIENRLFAAVENGIDSVNLNTFTYFHKATYGTTGALKEYKNRIYAGDGQGIKVIDPATLNILQQKNTSGNVKDIEIIDGVIYSLEWAGLKRYDAETLETVLTNSYYFSGPEMFVSEDVLYVNKNGSVVRLDFNGSAITETPFSGDVVELRDSYTYLNETYFPDGTKLRVSSMEPAPLPVCGNGVIETGEVCDGNTVQCTTLNSNYTSGTAYCNSTCDGYNESGCEEDDGW